MGQNISTIAGGGPRNLPALQTGFSDIAGLAADNAGNVFVALSYSAQIWKIDSSGRVNLYAGNGTFGFSGDGGQAANAAFCYPEGLALDTAGSLYVADSCNGRVRKVTSDGIVTTVAGGGASENVIGDGGQAVGAFLSYPVALALDASNNLYIADRYGQRVRYVSATSRVITTVAGNGVAGFSGDGGSATSAMINGPVGVAIDSFGVLYVADGQNNRLRKVVAGVISTVAGTGTAGYSGDGANAASAQLNFIAGVCVDRFNDIFILESSGVREIAAGQSNIVTFAGGINQGYGGDGLSPTSATFSFLTAMAFDGSLNLYVGDTGNYRIRKATLATVTTFAGNGTQYYGGDGLPATSANLKYLSSVAADNAGGLYFTDGSQSVRRFSLGSSVLSAAAGNGLYGFTFDGGAANSTLGDVTSVTYETNGSFFFVEGNRIRKVAGGVLTTVGNSSGNYGFSGDGGPALAAQFTFPTALALAQNGDLYIADPSNGRVRMINGQTKIVTTVAGNGSAASSGDGGPATAAGLNYPGSIALDGNGNLYIAEFYGSYVRKVNLSTGIITTVAGNGSCTFTDGVAAVATGLCYPGSIFADQSGNLFISDENHYRIRRVAGASNVITTVAGNGTATFTGDGGPATSAGIHPLAITVDRSQNLYITDNFGHIRTVPVSACFFTWSSPSYSASRTGGTGSMTVTATNPTCAWSVSSSSPFVTITSAASGTGSGTVAFSLATNTGVSRTATVSLAGQTFTVVQAGGAPQYNIGYFQPGTPQWVLDSNGSGGFDAGDRAFTFAGQPGAIAVVGDWNGDGRSKIGYYKDGFWVLDYNGNGVYDGVGGGDKFYAYGGAGANFVPIVGDWNGSGTTKIGYYSNGFWALDTNGSGSFDSGDSFYGFGGNGAGEIPVLGDWNGDKRTKVGFYYRGAWALDYNGDGAFTTADKYFNNFTFVAGDKPVVGDWTGDGKTKIGVYRGGFWIIDANGNGTFDGVAAGDRFYGFGGATGEVPIVADWNGDGRSKIGVYNNGFWSLDYNGNGLFDSGDRSIPFYGGTGSQPIIGRW